MKKIFNILIISIFIIVEMSSCSDFLQKDPTSSPSQTVFWQKKSDFEAALAGCYSVFHIWPGEMSQIIACFDNMTDNAIGQYDENNYGRAKTIALGDLTPQTDGFVLYMYQHCYQGIARVHLVMENLELYQGSDMSHEDRTFILAQCKALRGYFYSWLYLCYREVPLVTSSLTMDNMYKEKSSRKEIFEQIMKDYDDAISTLPEGVYTDSNMKGRMTIGAVKALKARILLSEAYDESGNASDKTKLNEVVALLESVSGYTLAGRMRDNFVTTTQSSSPEIMFSVKYLRPNLLNKLDLFYGDWAACQVTRDLVDEFECSDGLKWGESPLTESIDENIILDANTPEAIAERKKLFANRDRRLYETVMHSNYAQFPDVGYEDANPIIGNPQTHFNMMKLLQPIKTRYTYPITFSDAAIVITRYAEVLLMIAEAENEANGPTQKVYDAINAIRKRSLMPPLPNGLNKDEMRSRIKHEWRVEFAFEGHRYFQLKRWKEMETKVNGTVDPAIPTYKKVFMPSFYYFPIPQTEIDKANGVLTQDPNYK